MGPLCYVRYSVSEIRDMIVLVGLCYGYRIS